MTDNTKLLINGLAATRAMFVGQRRRCYPSKRAQQADSLRIASNRRLLARWYRIARTKKGHVGAREGIKTTPLPEVARIE